MNNLKEKLANKLLDLSIKYIRHYSKDSNYIKHANAEYKFTWPDYKEDEMQSYMCEQVNDLLALLDTQGDSGCSIGYKLNMLKKLMMFEPLSKLTFKDDEFNLCSIDGLMQNKRLSSVFKYPDGTFSYNNSLIKRSKYYIGKENVVKPGSNTCWHGGVFVIDDNGIYTIKNIRIKDTKTWDKNSFTIDAFEIEYPQDWWIGLCKESDLEEFSKYYTFEKDYEAINEELDFKGGIYKEELLKRIETIKNYINE